MKHLTTRNGLKKLPCGSIFLFLYNDEWGNIKIGSQILEIINSSLKAKHTLV
jgi:hypothetical protein